jgi:methionyl aminopeptidase
MSLIKTPKDLSLIRQAGRKLGKILAEIPEKVFVGISLIEIDQIIHQQILESGSTPSFLNFEGFPNASCLSLNAQVVHGIPDRRVLKEGDILGIDVGLWFQGVCVDAAVTVGVGLISPEAQKLIEDTRRSLEAGIKAVKPFRRIGAISAAVEQVAEKNKRGIVRNLTGHGVGHHVHEEPEIPNFGHPSDGILMRPGMVLAIEPMLTLGSGEVLTEIDGWGITTVDHSLAAHFEHTVIVTNRGVEVVTVNKK